jgi:hypothetical protein
MPEVIEHYTPFALSAQRVSKGEPPRVERPSRRRGDAAPQDERLFSALGRACGLEDYREAR